MWKASLVWCWIALFLFSAVWSGGLDLQGPLFMQEPPHRVEFSNSSGGKVDCTGHGSPAPDVEWITADGSPVHQVPELRLLFPNGSLVFPPFPNERYRHDVHSVVYRCRLRSQLGVVVSRDVQVKAVVKQKYDVQVHDEYVTAGNTAVLKCKIPNYVSEYVMVTSWVQDETINIYPNTDIGGKYVVLSNGDLYISNAGPGDGYKNYACRTVNRLTGEIQTSTYPGRIIVTEPNGNVQPRMIVDKYNARRCVLGEDVTLPCVAQGHPVPGYYWKRELQGQSVPVALGERHILLSAGLLKITKVRLEDRGVYVCFANNSAGEESVRVTLEITAPLSAHVQPQVQVVDVGKEASFQCIPNGFPVSQVSWMHNGKPVAPDSRVEVMVNPPRLTLRHLNKEDRGMYQCFVSNNWDQGQAIAELDMGDAGPELIHWFSEQTLQPGPMVSLKCVASGNPPPQFTWRLDGFPLPDHPRILVGQYVTFQDDVISHVNITSIKSEDGGEYTCTAHNSVGKISHSARVNVYGLPFIREMPKITGVAGSSLVIKCPVAGYPIETITWERDGQMLPVNRRQRVYANGTLVVEQTQVKDDAGTYTCQAQNRQRNSARRNVEVQVIVPPKIMPIQSMTGLLRQGMRAAINCQVMEGDLPLTFTWERDGKAVANNAALGPVIRRIDEFSSQLIIDQVTSDHTGNYTCIASNVAGREKYVVPLTVNVPPKWTVEPSDTNVASSQDAILHCQAEGYPKPVVTWKKAVEEQPGEYKDFLFQPNVQQYQNGSLSFVHISKENEGQYLCEAKNNIGAGVSKVIVLKVNAPAHFQQKSKQVQVVKGEQAHLQCSALGDVPMEITWKMGGQRMTKEGGDPRYNIREQTLAEGMVSELGIERTIRQDTGIFTCSASNAYGSDDMNIQLIVQEIPEAPRNVRVTDQLSRSIGISWTQPYAGNSPITNYIIQYKPGSEVWPNQPTKVTVSGAQTTTNIPNLRPATAYHLRILAENRLGLSDPSQTVQVNTLEEVPSGAPLDVRAEAKTSTELVVTWEPPPRETWNGNLLGYHVGFAEGTGNANSIHSYTFRSVEVRQHYGGEATLQSLSKFTTYNIIVQAYNSRGSGPASEPVTARTLEDAPSLPPENVQCSIMSAQSLHISWEPPLQEGRNGIIQGYKITYHSVGEWYDNDDQQTKNTAQLRTTLLGLRKFTNYSITVLAYTARGDGVRSESVYCQTEEDVPSAPADIKAVFSSSNKILVSWLPPTFSNGPLIGYTFYMSLVEGGRGENTHKRVLNPTTQMHEVVRIQDTATLQFWVTASTRIGEGESTRVVTVTPSKNVPARIASFGRQVVSAWKQDVNLDCKRVGIPLPTANWHHSDLPLEVGGRRIILPNATLVIKDVQSSDQANYSCIVENTYGRDEIVYSLKVLVPPDAPVLSVIESFTDTLHLKWSDQGNGGSPILGYVINYKRDAGDWEELQIAAHTDSHMLRDLSCGTKYLMYITAFNRIGTGLPCDIVTSHTKGTVPIKPKPSQSLTMNSTVVTVWLDTWGDGGCGISYFSVEFKAALHSSWTMASNHIKPNERIFSIGDLWPGTEYFLRITAYNNAGYTESIHNFTTLTLSGGIPEINPPVQHSEDQQPYFAKIRVWLPICLSLTVVIVLLLVAAFLRRKIQQDREIQNQSIGESPTMAQLQNKQNRDQQYLAVRVGRAPQPIVDDTETYKAESADYIEDICPYATFQLSKPVYSESSYSGNVYSGPYHPVRGSFVYHDVKPPPFDKLTLGHNKEHEYTKVRRKGGRLRDPHSESQEYDTLGSDSEGDGRATSQEMMSFNQRMRGGAEGTSSSSETSPHSGSIGRKPYPSKKGKNKVPALGKRHVRSSSGYSSHNDETTFSISHAPSFNDRIHPPSRFSDMGGSRELTESEYEKVRARGMTKLSREAFQINV
ncbi:Down syndrome cell adhesion molecule-like protein Dscam2 isoform X2 [Coccinella septempunctata]|uniref:Down syndrome cell adhesion molecule-like protein Dscam2 isoform X2 n=1 Tax=Coccinella septempunctata TaxID=41139 RepID=UPI001D0961E1|nr:Down syndrome cell adhesion molecule-like protein Dscam2 isoform X2 [Coccinella septempunctata]